MKQRRVGLHVRLPQDLEKRFRTYAAAKGVAQTAVIEAAMKQYLDGTLTDVALILRRLDRLGRSIERTQRDLNILTEAFSVWAQIWFASTPQVPESEQASAKSQAEARFRRFADYVAQQIAAGHNFVDDLAKDSLADPEELAQVANAENAND